MMDTHPSHGALWSRDPLLPTPISSEHSSNTTSSLVDMSHHQQILIAQHVGSQVWRLRDRKVDWIDTLPAEILQNIFLQTMEGSINDQLNNIKNIAVTNHKFFDQVTAKGPLQKVHEHLLSLRRTHPGVSLGSLNYDWWLCLEFQSSSVRKRIEMICSRYPRLPRERDDHYILRLGRRFQTIDDALFLVLGFVTSAVCDCPLRCTWPVKAVLANIK